VVKKILLSFLLISFCYADTSLVKQKVINLVSPDDYKIHKGFIDILFRDDNKFFTNSRINVIKIIKILQDNGLFKFMFQEPVNMSISFETHNTDNVLLVIKSVQDVLHTIGYGFFITTQAQYNRNTLKWSINFKTNAGMDPILLNKELNKRGITIQDIIQYGKTKWTYKLDTKRARLNDTYKIQKHQEVKIKKRNSDIFIQPIDISDGYSSITITSNPKNTWYPYIVFYDEQLRILKIKKVDRRIKRIKLQIPPSSFYIKLSDIYINKNITNGFRVLIE